MVVRSLKLPVVDLAQHPHLPPRVGDPMPQLLPTMLETAQFSPLASSSPPPDQESSAPRSPPPTSFDLLAVPDGQAQLVHRFCFTQVSI